MSDDRSHRSVSVTEFLVGAAIFEGLLLIVAFALGALVGIRPTKELQWSWEDTRWGLVATIPMLLLLAACWLSRSQGLLQIRARLRGILGPLLDGCRLIDILLLAILAGVCEEVLFRGLVYQFIQQWNPTLAVMVTNVLFGLAHAVTPLYAWLAGLAGLYLTALMSVDSTPNLLLPIVAHAAYDFVALLLLRWDYRRFENRSAGTGTPGNTA